MVRERLRPRPPDRDTYVNDTIVVCVLEDILSAHEDQLIARGSSSAVIDARVAFQTDLEDEFTAAVDARRAGESWRS